MRIVRVRWKVAYFAAFFALGFPADAALDHLLLPEASILANTVITALVYLGASRWFRGSGEPVAPSRAWWRMTARPKGSRVLGILSTIGAVTSPLLLTGEHGLFVFVTDLALWVTFAALFFHSYARLRREKPPGSTLPTTAEWRPAPLPRALR